MITQTLQSNETTPKYKSVKLTKTEVTKLGKFVNEFPNKELAAAALGLNNRNTLANIMRGGSGSSDSITLIRSKINTAA